MVWRVRWSFCRILWVSINYGIRDSFRKLWTRSRLFPIQKGPWAKKGRTLNIPPKSTTLKARLDGSICCKIKWWKWSGRALTLSPLGFKSLRLAKISYELIKCIEIFTPFHRKFFLRKLRKMHYFRRFLTKFNQPCVDFLRVWTKNTIYWKFWENCEKCIILADFSQNLTNQIFCAFGRKTQIVGKFWDFEKILKFFDENSIEKLNFLFFSKYCY